MTLKQLQYFMAVASTLSFTEAAKERFISQPALSRAISDLEAELNVRLLTRDHHTVSLTPAGSLLAAELPKLKQELERLFILARQTDDGIMGRLSIGMQQGQQIDESVFVTFDYFRQSVPLVELRPCSLELEGLLEGLQNGSIDLIFAVDQGLSSRRDLNTLPLDEVEYRMALPATHRLAGRQKTPLSAFSREQFIVSGDADSADARFQLALCADAGFTPKLCPVADDRTKLLWIESGFGVSIFNSGTLQFPTTRLKFIPLSDVHPGKLVLAWKKDAHNPSTRLFTHVVSCCL